ncbi:hypothetical protein C5167_049879 [Papaver somniferum]|uniref:Uncharacterized protein n=1 Tax=Papaver somniferum TaxID=3469 RepID=A0A4Y7KR77_PAPSO|nr:hypothetical protein C5167_049879 [Papaver somniferum]
MVLTYINWLRFLLHYKMIVNLTHKFECSKVKSSKLGFGTLLVTKGTAMTQHLFRSAVIQATTKVSDLSDIKFSLTPSLRSRA